MSNALTRDEVAKVALLARLKLSEAELETFTAQLGQVLQYVHVLNEVETENVEPMAHAVEVTDAFRADEISPSLSRADVLGNAPNANNRYFVVPQILEV